MPDIQDGLATLHTRRHWRRSGVPMRLPAGPPVWTGWRPQNDAVVTLPPTPIDDESEGITEISVEERFKHLADIWRADTEFDSAPTSLFGHPAYLEITKLGQPALPLLLADLAATGSFWFQAIRTISGEDPVPPEDRGNISRMKEHWLTWGREHGYLNG